MALHDGAEPVLSRHYDREKLGQIAISPELALNRILRASDLAIFHNQLILVPFDMSSVVQLMCIGLRSNRWHWGQFLARSWKLDGGEVWFTETSG